VKLVYFAWVRQKVGIGEESLSLPPDVTTVSELVTYLAGRGAGYRDAFVNPARLRAAINQDHVHFDAPVHDDDEVAFFPPVTGG
jgi:molybdopterin converting factor subunit 1